MRAHDYCIYYCPEFALGTTKIGQQNQKNAYLCISRMPQRYCDNGFCVIKGTSKWNQYYSYSMGMNIVRSAPYFSIFLYRNYYTFGTYFSILCILYLHSNVLCSSCWNEQYKADSLCSASGRLLKRIKNAESRHGAAWYTSDNRK